MLCSRVSMMPHVAVLHPNILYSNMQAAHPVLGQSKELQLFLEATEEEWAMEVSRASFEVNGGAKKKLAGALQAFRDLGQSTAQLMSGKSYDDEEDPEYLKVGICTTTALPCRSL